MSYPTRDAQNTTQILPCEVLALGTDQNLLLGGVEFSAREAGKKRIPPPKFVDRICVPPPKKSDQK